MPHSLSIVLITLNEEANLARTLESVRGLGEIVVVDSGSTDSTLAIARSYGARVFIEPWQGFGAQKNAAIAHAAGEWILSLDADEEVSPELKQEIEAMMRGEPQFHAYKIPRLNHFLGKPLRHGGYWPDPKLRLLRRGRARFEERAVHETMRADCPVGLLSGYLIHHCYPTLIDYREHMDRYSTLGAQAMIASGRAKRSGLWYATHAWLNPAATFLYNYGLRGGFLDGRPGFLQHWHHSGYVHAKYAKAWRMARQDSDTVSSR